MRKVWMLTALLMGLPVRAEVRFAVISDAGVDNAVQRGVRDSIHADGITRVVMPGDNIYDEKNATYADAWDSWLKLGFTFDVVAIGNHSLGYAEEVEYFDLPGEYYARTYPEDDVRFIVLNSDNGKKKFLAQQNEWMERELAAATESAIFLVYHHPSYSMSSDHPASDREKFQAYVRPALRRYRDKITAVLTGHDHVALVAHFDDLPVLLSGATQELDDDRMPDRVEDGARVETNWYFNGNPQWLRLVVDRGDVNASFVDATNSRTTCSMKLVSGERARLSANCSP